LRTKEQRPIRNHFNRVQIETQGLAKLQRENDAKVVFVDEQIRGRRAKNRNSLSIINDILTIARQGALKTQIMYRASLSFDQLNLYLALLLKNNLIEQTKSDERQNSFYYKTTVKGNLFIQRYLKLRDLLALTPSQWV
jgi:predicted transcriptional regulator